MKVEEGKRLRLQSHDVIQRMYRNSRFRTKDELAEIAADSDDVRAFLDFIEAGERPLLR